MTRANSFFHSSRRSFLKSTAAAALAFPWVRTRAAAPDDSELLAEARERIQTHRKSSRVIRLRGAGGKPIAGAEVRLEQLQHEFLFGCNFFMFERAGSPELDFRYGKQFADLLNFATLGFYWGAYEPRRGEPNYHYTARAAKWCELHAITCKGHPLAWDHPASSPRWLPESDEEIERLSTTRVRDCVERFRGRINIWDVVNEPTDLTRFKNRMNTWAARLGAVPYTKLHLQNARAAATPGATLLVNDYRTDPAFLKILDALRDNGKLMFDAIGIQSHMHDRPWALGKVWEVCDRFKKLELPIHFTEATVVSGARRGPGENWAESNAEGEARQAEYVPKFYTMLFAHPAARALTWWDFADRGAWQGAAAGFLRKDLSPKPVYEQLHGLIKKEWWTNVIGTTNEAGELSTRAFFGQHRLKVVAPAPARQRLERDVDWRRGDLSPIELSIL